MEKKVYKLIDRTLVMGCIMEDTDSTVTLKQPISVTVQMGPNNQPMPALVSLDIIFDDVIGENDNVTIKKDQIMWEKPLEHFPTYFENYNATLTDIVQAAKPGIIT